MKILKRLVLTVVVLMIVIVTAAYSVSSYRFSQKITFADQTPGRRLRSWLRFAHTGEYYGLTGQTVAGLVSAGGVVLVWTGLALALRRLTAWIGRRRQTATPARKAA